MTDDGQFKPDLERWKRCSAPHETTDDANAAAVAFEAEIDALREKYKIANLYVLASVCVKKGEALLHAPFHLLRGNLSQCDALLGRAYHETQAESYAVLFKDLAVDVRRVAGEARAPESDASPPESK